MSEVYVPRAGYTGLLDALTAGLVAYVHLYTNDPALDDDLTKDSFVEVIMEGYVEQSMGRWTPAALRAGLAVSVCDPVSFVFAGGPVPLPVRGYYLTQHRNGPLLWVWRRPDVAFQFDADHPLLLIYGRLTFPLVCP